MEKVNNLKYSEKDCWLRVKKGDHEAFRWIYDLTWKYLYHVAYSFTRDVDASNDLVQDVFTDLWKNRQRIDETRPPLPYLRGMIKFKIISYLRHLSLGRKEAFISRIKNELYDEGVCNETLNSVYFNDLDSSLRSYLNEVPSKSRKIFELSRFENYSNHEIAREMDISIKTVEYHINKVITIFKPRVQQLFEAALSLSIFSLLY